MSILARLRLAKIRTMARPNSPDMPPKRTKKVRLGIKSGPLDFDLFSVCVKGHLYHPRTWQKYFIRGSNRLLSTKMNVYSFL